MCFYCIGMRINFFSKVTRVHEATKKANDTSLCFTILVLSLEFHSSRLGWNIPYEQTTEFVPVTEPAWYRVHMKRPLEACARSLFTRTRKHFTRINFSVVCLLQVRRMEKKANKMAFKSEKQRQEQSLLNTKQQQGKKLWWLHRQHFSAN